MEIVIYGARGSYPATDADFMKFGGNTTCILISLQNEQKIIFDGGTGLYQLGLDLASQFSSDKKYKLDLILSHTHWDHILGLPHFRPFHMHNVEVTIHGPCYGFESLEKLYAGQQNELHFPVKSNKMNAKISFHQIDPGDSFRIKVAKISTTQLNHPGKTIGYRIEADGKVMTTLTDTGPIENNHLGVGMALQFGTLQSDLHDTFNESLLNLARNADLLLHDSHFMPADIEGKEHWGHSTSRHAIDRAIKAKAKRLLLFHHNPLYNDNTIEKLKNESLEKSTTNNIEIITAYEGLRIKL